MKKKKGKAVKPPKVNYVAIQTLLYSHYFPGCTSDRNTECWPNFDASWERQDAEAQAFWTER